MWEIFNEPTHHVTWAVWVPMAQQLIDTIRSKNPVSKVIVAGTVNWCQQADVQTLKIRPRQNRLFMAPLFKRLWKHRRNHMGIKIRLHNDFRRRSHHEHRMGFYDRVGFSELRNAAYSVYEKQGNKLDGVDLFKFMDTPNADVTECGGGNRGKKPVGKLNVQSVSRYNVRYVCHFRQADHGRTCFREEYFSEPFDHSIQLRRNLARYLIDLRAERPLRGNVNRPDLNKG